MDAERSGRITAIGVGTVAVQVAPTCDNCSGCAGRCSLLAGLAASGDRIEIPLNRFDGSPGIGRPVRLYLPQASVLRHARVGYGWPLAGLVLGAALGHGLATASGAAPDAWAVLLASAGTYAGVIASKRAMPPACRAAAVDSSDSDSVPPDTACKQESVS